MAEGRRAGGRVGVLDNLLLLPYCGFGPFFFFQNGEWCFAFFSFTHPPIYQDVFYTAKVSFSFLNKKISRTKANFLDRAVIFFAS